LLETTIDGASGVIFNVTGGPDLTLHEVQEAANVIYSAVSDEANIIFGAVLDDRLHGEVLITVIATGFDMLVQSQPKARPTQASTPNQQQQRVEQQARPAQQVQQQAQQSQSNELKKMASDILDIPEFLKQRNPSK
jgi:cell division protein FtsZ